MLEVINLGASRGYRTLFANLSLSIQPGEVVELRGANGSGKSTFLRILAGLTRQAAGSYQWDDQHDPSAILHFLGHMDGVKPQETALAQARFWAGFLGGDVKQAEQVLNEVGLGNRLDVPGRGLSAGQKRRLALSRLILAPRKVWLLDEPLAALDVDGQALVRTLAADHVKAGGVIIAAMHGDGFDGAKTLDLANYRPQQREVA